MERGAHEVTLLSPPPRPIRRRRPSQAGTWLVRLFILPHTLVGIGLTFFLLLVFALILFGSNTQGHVLEKSTSKVKNGYAYHIHYQYEVDHLIHTKKETVSLPEYNALNEGSEIQVKYLNFGFHVFGTMIRPQPHPWQQVGMVVFFTVFWNGIVMVFAWAIYIDPWIRKRLVQLGVTAEGKILSKDVVRRKTAVYQVQYEFRPAFGPMRIGTMQVQQADWEQAEAGQQVTILHFANHPRWSLIYRFADFEAL